MIYTSSAMKTLLRPNAMFSIKKAAKTIMKMIDIKAKNITLRASAKKK
jgi:uncharacterized protein YlaN (UPF0358 family)